MCIVCIYVYSKNINAGILRRVQELHGNILISMTNKLYNNKRKTEMWLVQIQGKKE